MSSFALFAGAVVAVSVFGDVAPANFEVSMQSKFHLFKFQLKTNQFYTCAQQAFSLAFITMFRITAGDQWPDEPSLYDNDGTVNWKVGTFQMAYEISVKWVILQERLPN